MVSPRKAGYVRAFASYGNCGMVAGMNAKGTYLPGEGDIAVRVWQTTAAKPFREVFTTPFTHHPYGDKAPLDVDCAVADHRFLGVGASMTDASAWLLSRMSPERRGALLEAAFSPDPEKGAGLSALRLNIGASDYATALYSYDDVPGDVEMRHFSAARDDHWVFPMTKAATAVNPGMYLFAAPWSPPGWMKDNGHLCGGNFADGNERALANYLVAYAKVCRERGLDLGALCVQNEPFCTSGIYPTCGYTMEQLARASIELTRRLREEGFDTAVWFWDHNYDDAEAVGKALSDETLRSAVGGVAWHSYSDGVEAMGKLHRQHPDLPFFHTEQGPALISTERTERWWCDRIFNAFENGCGLFTAWNLCLDDDGQPLTGPHTCAGLLSTNPETGDIEESALYRVMRHIGPFVRRDARLLHVAGDRDGTATVFFRNPDGSHVLVIGCAGRAEGRDGPPRARVHVKYRDEWLAVPLPMDVWSITTVVFKPRDALVHAFPMVR